MSSLPPVDLRSDTVTRPTPAMREAMAAAVVGDDVLGDDPTVHELEALAAKMLGKEAAVFVPSGTMGNQLALAAHCQPGDIILVEEEAHIVYYEVGGPALLAGVLTFTLPSNRGVIDLGEIRRRCTRETDHTPATRLLCLENTHNRAGGAVVPQQAMRAYRGLADELGVRVHLDGARMFNAAVAQGISAADLAQNVDSVSVCLSKGLGAPVGSVLAGDSDFIARARRWRKRLGGGMRQAGILAAAGIFSLTRMVDRLAEDHFRARRLAQELSEIPGFGVNLDHVETNMVRVETEEPAAAVQTRLEELGVLCFAVGAHRLRLVTHHDVDDEGIERAVAAFQRAAKLPAGRG